MNAIGGWRWSSGRQFADDCINCGEVNYCKVYEEEIARYQHGQEEIENGRFNSENNGKMNNFDHLKNRSNLLIDV